MSSTPMTNLLNVVNSEATKSNSSSAHKKSDVSNEGKFKEMLANAMDEGSTVKKQPSSEPVKSKASKTSSAVRDSDEGREEEVAKEVDLNENWTLSLLQAAMMAAPGQKNASSSISPEDNPLYSQSNGSGQGTGLIGAGTGSGRSSKGGYALSSKGGGLGDNTATSLLGSGGTGALKNTALDEMLSDLWSNIYNKKDIIQANSLDSSPSAQVVLSQEWSPGNLGGPLSLNGEGAVLGSSLKSIQAAVGDYWVPPVQVTTKGPTEATVQVSLRGGGTLTLHLQLSDAQNVALKIDAPAAALAELQSRLAPLQAAFLQQGLVLAPIQWGQSKGPAGPAGRIAASSNSEKENSVGERAIQTDSEASSSNLLAGSAIPAASFVEDLLE